MTKITYFPFSNIKLLVLFGKVRIYPLKYKSQQFDSIAQFDVTNLKTVIWSKNVKNRAKIQKIYLVDILCTRGLTDISGEVGNYHF